MIVQQHHFTLLLPTFWQICFLSAKFISAVRGIMPYEASTFYEYHNSYLKKLRTPPTQQNVCKWGTSSRVREGVQVADWRHWQSAMAAKEFNNFDYRYRYYMVPTGRLFTINIFMCILARAKWITWHSLKFTIHITYASLHLECFNEFQSCILLAIHLLICI